MSIYLITEFQIELKKLKGKIRKWIILRDVNIRLSVIYRKIDKISKNIEDLNNS